MLLGVVAGFVDAGFDGVDGVMVDAGREDAGLLLGEGLVEVADAGLPEVPEPPAPGVLSVLPVEPGFSAAPEMADLTALAALPELPTTFFVDVAEEAVRVPLLEAPTACEVISELPVAELPSVEVELASEEEAAEDGATDALEADELGICVFD